MFDIFNKIYSLRVMEFRRVLWKYPSGILWEFKIELCLIKEHFGLRKQIHDLDRKAHDL